MLVLAHTQLVHALVMHLSKSPNPVVAQLVRHFAKHHCLVVVGQDLLSNLELEVHVFLTKLAEEDLKRLL